MHVFDTNFDIQLSKAAFIIKQSKRNFKGVASFPTCILLEYTLMLYAPVKTLSLTSSGQFLDGGRNQTFWRKLP